MQSSAGSQSPTVGGSAGGVMILSAGSPSSPPPQPPQPAAPAAVTPGGIVIRSATGASPPQPSYNDPAQAPAPVVQPQPVAITPSPPAPQVVVGGGVSPAATASGVIRVGSVATSPQVYRQPQPGPTTLNQPTAMAARPPTAVDQTTTSARTPAAAAAQAPATAGKPRLTPRELFSKADPLWVCGFLLAVVSVAFATMAFEDEVSTTWLLLFVSAASLGAFVKLQL